MASIHYIRPLASANSKVITLALAADGVVTQGVADGIENIIQDSIEKAIRSTIIEPCKALVVGLWDGFVASSFVVCSLVGVGGVIFMLCDIKKGKQVAIGSAIVYAIIKMADAVLKGAS